LKMSPVPKIPWKLSIAKKVPLFFLTEEGNNIEEKRKGQRRCSINEQRNQKCKQSQYFRSTRSDKEKK
jgi:hypothetical protein